MRRVTINIGLNNNTMTFNQALESLNNLEGYEVISVPSKAVIGQYVGQDEPTIVIELMTSLSNGQILVDFENLAELMNQECIAVSTDGMDILAFSKTYEGEKYNFDLQYFLHV
jgi:hypothetical protein